MTDKGFRIKVIESRSFGLFKIANSDENTCDSKSKRIWKNLNLIVKYPLSIYSEKLDN